jgi:DNA-directed RNA polymerase beta' subunit
MHAIVGRIGVIDTALKTSSSGYTQRKCVKVCEDITVKYDSTVRDINNKIIQFSYGDTDLDGQKTIMVDDEMQFVNISRLAEQMNSQHEIKHHIL